jgi:hypothetical protein
MPLRVIGLVKYETSAARRTGLPQAVVVWLWQYCQTRVSAGTSMFQKSAA